MDIKTEEVRGYTIREAIDEAKRCLQCPKPSCKNGCPINNDIPEFINALAKGNVGLALEIIQKKSNLPAVCGRVCPHELQCEGHCVLAKKGKNIKIGMIERFIADFDFDMNLTKEKVVAKTRGKVAVIGSGPAGLTVAGDLSKEGFNVTVFEAAEEPGGVLLYGIPSFRLPKTVVAREIERIESLGIQFITGKMVGPEFTVDDIFAEGYDAIFIGTGTALGKELNVPGNNLVNVMQSNYLLRMIALYNSNQINEKEIPLSKDDKIVIIGGGNVAMDAARSAKRLGVKDVKVVYYNKQEKMGALRAEYEGAVEDGVEFLFETNTLEFLGEDGILTGMKVENSDGIQVLETSRVFLAVGSKPANRIVSSTNDINVDERGYVIVHDKPYGMTTRHGVFAGGDVVHQPATVVLAMKEAQKVSKGIMAYVDAVKLLGAI